MLPCARHTMETLFYIYTKVKWKLCTLNWVCVLIQGLKHDHELLEIKEDEGLEALDAYRGT